MSIESKRLSVVLVETSNPLNIGAAARAMSNFGFLQLRVVNPYEVAFREARSAVGAASEVLADAVEYKSVAEAVADCTLVIGTTAVRHRELQHPVRRLEYGGRLIRKELTTGRVALLFGTEKTGLSNDDLSHCHWLINIPTREQHISMNLGQAVAVCLYELMRDPKKAIPAKTKKLEKPASAEVERISTVLLETLHLSGYVNPISVASTEERVRRMVRRLNLTSSDAELWLGMFRQMLWKAKHGGDSKK
jgi:tRNA/rRNA methyltransferase